MEQILLYLLNNCFQHNYQTAPKPSHVKRKQSKEKKLGISTIDKKCPQSKKKSLQENLQMPPNLQSIYHPNCIKL